MISLVAAQSPGVVPTVLSILMPGSVSCRRTSKQSIWPGRRRRDLEPGDQAGSNYRQRARERCKASNGYCDCPPEGPYSNAVAVTPCDSTVSMYFPNLCQPAGTTGTWDADGAWRTSAVTGTPVLCANMAPWQGDAVSLVEAFRSGDRTPVEEMADTLAVIDQSQLNAFSHLDPSTALDQARRADLSKPLGGVPIGVKELNQVEGMPDTEASLVFRDRVADHSSTFVTRLREAGAIVVGLTTASEFGGVNCTRTKLNGITGNPWKTDRTPGGSSGGSGAAVSGGLVTLCTSGDGGGSTRIPAGFCGMVGLRPTYGRIPKGPNMVMSNMTAVHGCISRSVRDTARFFDVANGFDPRDPFSLPRVEGWEAGLGTLDLGGLRVAISDDLGNAVVRAEVAAVVRGAAEALIADAAMTKTDVDVSTPDMAAAWAITGSAGLLGELGDRWPGCRDDLTPQIRFGLELAEELFDATSPGKVEERRVQLNEHLADVFDQVDIVLCPTNPDVAFAASGPLPTVVDGVDAGPGNNGALTIPANIYGNPSISVPVGVVDGLPVGMQIMAGHHREPLLLELAALVERERPWPQVAPEAPA